jgi:diacylglycerol kinase family enzyme
MHHLLTCILNSKAGSNRTAEAQALIDRAALAHGCEARVFVSSTGSDLYMLAEQARTAGGLIVAGGGDGTIAAVAAALAGKDALLGVLPMGTLNHFAKDLRIPLELTKAVETLFIGKPIRVDVGEVNGRIFVNNSSIGFYPQIVQGRHHQQRRGRNKWLALSRAAVVMLQGSRTLHIEKLDGDPRHRQSYDTPFVFVGNNRYELAGFEIGRRAALDAGKLWVCTAPYAGRCKLLVLAIEALLGRVHEPDLAVFETDRTNVHMHQRHVHVATDGEVHLMRTPLRYRILPAALRVVAP